MTDWVLFSIVKHFLNIPLYNLLDQLNEVLPNVAFKKKKKKTPHKQGSIQ